MTERPVQAVLLDLGGVLIRVHFERTLEHWARAAGVPTGHFGERFRPCADYERHERGERDFAGYAASLRRQFDVRLDDATLREGWNLALGEAMPGAADLVAALRERYPVYLFSNSNAAHHACWSRDQAALLSGFREVFVSHLLGLRKPDPQAFNRVVSRIGGDAGAIAFFDDLEENVAGARAAGLAAFRVTGPADVAHVLDIPMPDPGVRSSS